MTTKPKVAIVTNNYCGNAFIPSFITSLNSQTFLSFGEIELLFIDAKPNPGVKSLLTNEENFTPGITVKYIEPVSGHISYAQGILKAKDNTDSPISIKLDVDDRLSPYGVEIFYREFCSKNPLIITGWEIITDCIAVAYDDISRGALSIPKKITTLTDLFFRGKGLRKSCAFGNIIAYNTGVASLVDSNIQIFVFESVMAELIKAGKTHEIIPEVIGSHAIHPAGLRHGDHNEEAFLSEGSLLMEAYKDDL